MSVGKRERPLGLVARLALVLFLAGPAGAAEKAGATNEIAGLKGMRLMETEHFRLYYDGASPSKFRNILEKVWNEAVTVMPRLETIAKTGELDAEPPSEPEEKEEPQEEQTEGVKGKPRPSVPKSPARSSRPKAKGQGENAMKMVVIFADQRPSYETAARSQLPANLPDETRQQADTAIKTLATFSMDPQTRVYWTGDPQLKVRGFDIFIAHVTAVDLLHLNMGQDSAPFCLSAGLGYHMEFKFFGKSVTGYLDYEQYYGKQYSHGGANAGKYSEKETLAIGKPWAPILKQLMLTKNKKGNLQTVLSAQTTSLTPETCGYIYAFTDYLLNGSKQVAMFRKFLEDLRLDNGQNMENHLLDCFSQDNLDMMQKDWHTFIQSNRFK